MVRRPLLGAHLAGMAAFVSALAGSRQAALADDEASVPQKSSNESEACKVAFVHTQELLRTDRLGLARLEAAVCEQTCPENIAPSCTGWRYEAEARMPSFVPDAYAADGARVVDVTIFVDGQRVTETLDGAIAVEPGTHRVRFVRKGSSSVELTFVARLNKKREALRVVFPAAADQAGPRDPVPRAGSGLPPTTYVFGAVGLASLVGAGALWLHGELRRNQLGGSCAPHCSDADQVDPIRTEWSIAGVLAGVGALSVGVAVVMVAAHETARPRPSGLASLKIGVVPATARLEF